MWLDRDPGHRFNVLYSSVGRGYFETLHLPLVAGRDFDETDTISSEPVVIVNEALASTLPPATQVVGARIVREATPLGPERTFRIVGVARNSKYLDLKEKLSPVAFMADMQEPAPGYARIVVRFEPAGGDAHGGADGALRPDRSAYHRGLQRAHERY